MKWIDFSSTRFVVKASQTTRIVWLAFTVLGLALSIPMIPRYVELLQIACSGAGCFETQLTLEAARVWAAAGRTLQEYALLQTSVLLLMDGLLLSTAVLLIWRKVNDRVSVLAAIVLTALATSTLSQALAYSDPRFGYLAQLIRFVQTAGLLPIACLFPDGKFQPRWMNWAALGYILLSLIYLLPRNLVWFTSGIAAVPVQLGFASIAVLAAASTWTGRYRRATTPEQREQIRWVFAGIGLVVLVIGINTPLRLIHPSFLSFEILLPDLYERVVYTGMFLAVGAFTCFLVALFNYGPLDTDLHLNRTLVYGALTALIISGYALLVGAVGGILRADGNLAISLAVITLVAIAANPLRERLQRAANRLMYGEREEPYRVVTRLSQLLEAANQPAGVLQLSVETVAHALKLPYVCIELMPNPRNQTPDSTTSGAPIEIQNAAYEVAASYGTPINSLSIFPLLYAGETIGQLTVASRAPNELLTEADQPLLFDLAKQISLAAHTAILTTDLEYARLRIVEAGEEARRRLGNDLHDGIGHVLTGLARKTEMVSNQLESEPTRTRDALAEIVQQLNVSIDQVRTLAHQLHPPELELLGLVGALRERAQTNNRFAIQFDAPDSLPPLPTATETAAYYIAVEALTNVEKHAGAKTCGFHLRLVEGFPSTLELDITDDGRGLPTDMNSGLGLITMQARAVEVGGTCRIGSTAQGGTRVSVRLPCSPRRKGV